MKQDGYQIVNEALSLQMKWIPGQSIKDAVKGLIKTSRSLARKNVKYKQILTSYITKFQKTSDPVAKKKIAKDMAHIIKVRQHNSRIKKIVDKLLSRHKSILKKDSSYVVPPQYKLRHSSGLDGFEKPFYLKTHTLNKHLDLVKQYYRDIMKRSGHLIR